jgi:hypothetical protein
LKKTKSSKEIPIRVAQGIDRLGGLLTEQCRLYRAARRGEITPTEGYKLMQMLGGGIRGTIESKDDDDLRARVAALENDK